MLVGNLAVLDPDNDRDATRINTAARAAGLTPRVVENRDLDQRLGPEAVHQGLLLEARPLPDADIADIASNSGLVLVLDQITDPQNVGAILRSACAFGVDALIVQDNGEQTAGWVALALHGAGVYALGRWTPRFQYAAALAPALSLAALTAVAGLLVLEEVVEEILEGRILGQFRNLEARRPGRRLCLDGNFDDRRQQAAGEIGD